jgi:hypothetical protein
MYIKHVDIINNVAWNIRNYRYVGDISDGDVRGGRRQRTWRAVTYVEGGGDGVDGVCGDGEARRGASAARLSAERRRRHDVEAKKTMWSDGSGKIIYSPPLVAGPFSRGWGGDPRLKGTL